MKKEYQKSYNEILDKIKRNTYNIKKEDYQEFLQKTKANTLESFLYFSESLFQNRKNLKETKKLWLDKNISYKKFKQLRLANFYFDLFFVAAPFCSTSMKKNFDEFLQIAYHTKGSYQEKALATFEYLAKNEAKESKEQLEATQLKNIYKNLKNELQKFGSVNFNYTNVGPEIEIDDTTKNERVIYILFQESKLSIMICYKFDYEYSFEAYEAKNLFENNYTFSIYKNELTIEKYLNNSSEILPEIEKKMVQLLK